VEWVSTAGRRENAVARCTHRRMDGVDGGFGVLEHAWSVADSGGRQRAWRGGRRRCCRSAGCGTRGREAAVRTPAHGPDSALKARERRSAGVWQPRGDGALTGGPGAESGG
jgi:hypothetical protein